VLYQVSVYWFFLMSSHDVCYFIPRYTPTANAYNIGYCLTFSMLPMKKATPVSPSTNVPMVCPVCHPDLALPEHCLDVDNAIHRQSKKKKALQRPAVWKYNMALHFDASHGGSSLMPPGLVTDCTMSILERDMVLATKGLSRFKS